ncbi:MAG: DUF4149 domain-containing protein [Polyangiaceae bacterium]
MNDWYLLSVILHVLAAMLWVGGMGFFALVVVPVVRRTSSKEEARKILRETGTRFATIGWVALGVLVATGVGNLAFRGNLPALARAEFWHSPFGAIFAAKMSVVALVLVLSLLHSLDARRPSPTDAARARATSLGRLTFVLSTVIVVLAVMLVRGPP